MHLNLTMKFDFPKMVLILFVPILVCLQGNAVENICHSFYSSHSETNALEAIVREYRQKAMLNNPPDPMRYDWEREIHYRPANELAPDDNVTIQNVTLKVTGILGEAGTKAYLATDPQHGEVVIKIPSSRMFIFEKRLTEFLLSQGFDVPKILYDDGRVMVKEYFLGLTYNEVKKVKDLGLFSKLGWRDLDLERIHSEFEILEKQYQNLVNGRFSVWFHHHYPEEYVKMEGMKLLEMGDLSKQNYLYSVTLKRWRKYDP